MEPEIARNVRSNSRQVVTAGRDVVLATSEQLDWFPRCRASN
jgi:hypothetical protein